MTILLNTLLPPHPPKTENRSDDRQRILSLFRDWTSDPDGKGRLLVTCRPEETGLAGVRRIGLAGLQRPDSLYLLAEVLRKHDLSLDDSRLDREQLEKLLDILDDHPLSIELVGPHLRDLSPERIVADFHQLLERFATGDAEVERNSSLLASLQFSTSRLSGQAQQLLPWLGLFQGGVFEVVLLDISQVDPAVWEAVRGELEATALVRVESGITIGDRPYLRFHPTLAYAAQRRPDQAQRRSGNEEGRPDQAQRRSGNEEGRPDQAQRRSGNEANNDPSIGNDLQSTAGTALRSVRPTSGSPTLDSDEVWQRFIMVYAQLTLALDKLLRGSNARTGMQVLALEEANFRRAVYTAVDTDQFDLAAAMGDTFRLYLERSARLRERDRWSTWLAKAAEQVQFSEAVAAAERNRAWSLFTQGQAAEAVQRLKTLIDRLQNTTEFDPAFQLALANHSLGRVYQVAGHAERAIPILTEAAEQWEQLVAQASSRTRESSEGPSQDGSRARESSGDRSLTTSATDIREWSSDQLQACSTQLGNLSAALGDLANAFRAAGRLDEALATSERAVAIRTALENHREVAAGHTRTAQILMQQGRYQEADARYDQALEAVRRVSDRELEGSILQHQGLLARRMQQYDRAIDLYQQSLKLFQEANDDASIMRTCNLLGVVEKKVGRLAEAREWYGRSREIAHDRKDTEALGIAAQNLGIVCQMEGEAALQQADEATAQQHFQQAEQFLLEASEMDIQRCDKPGEAQSHGQLALLYLLMNDLDQAEQHAHQAREIHETLGLKEVWKEYHILAQIAQARGNETEAAEWETKRDAKRAELERLARGGDPPDAGLPRQMVEAIGRLAVLCLQAGLASERLDDQVDATLTHLESDADSPLQTLGSYLRHLAAGPADQTRQALAAPPANLPESLPEVFKQLLEAARQG